MASWSDPAPSAKSPPAWWSRLLDAVASDTLYNEFIASAGNVAELRKVPEHCRALAWARAAAPPLIVAPSEKTLQRLRANVIICAAGKNDTRITATSREAADIPDSFGDSVIQMNEMPIARVNHWSRLHVRADLLCHTCDTVVKFEDRANVVLSDDLARAYCSQTCLTADAETYAETSAANLAMANKIVCKWRRLRMWPFCVTCVRENDKVKSLPLDIRVSLGMSSVLERTNLKDHLSPEEASFVDLRWSTCQESCNSVIVLEEQERKRRNAIEVARTKFHSTLQRAVETARASEA